MSDFNTLRKQVQKQYAELSKSGEKIFYKTIDRDKIWEAYLNGFADPVEKQEHTCNCCKSFLRQYGGIVAIRNGKVTSIWDISLDGVDESYHQPVKNLQEYVASLPVTDVFLVTQAKLGTDKNFDPKQSLFWNHFFLEVDKKFVVNGATSIDSLLGSARDQRNVFKRGLDEITRASLDSVVELIEQNSIYRGKEFEAIVREFLKVKKEYDKVKKDQKEAFCWEKSSEASGAIGKLKNSAIGTLLIDISEGMELDKAVARFEKMVAPSNYKRPTPVVTQKMIEEAQKKIVELGYETSLSRRHANLRDIGVDKMLFVDRAATKNGLFHGLGANLEENIEVNPKKLDKVEEVTIDKFIDIILPKSKSIELLVENRHLGNFVSLLTADDKESKSMFKWNNPFSWSYTGGITDSDMRKEVLARGGSVTGVFRFTHQWNYGKRNASLMDLHVFMPGSTIEPVNGVNDGYGNAQRVGWNNRKHPMSGGVQDVDYTNPAPTGYVPVENITFPSLNKMPEGRYICKIHNWQMRAPNEGGFKAEIEFGGEIYQYEVDRPLKNKEWITVAEVTLKDGAFTIKHHLEPGSAKKSAWGISTQQFHKVNAVMLSPNHWDTNVGNKHYMFMLDKCVADEPVRPIFNEFLKDDLITSKRLFEVLGSKLKVPETTDQISGVGFSDTKRDNVIVRVDGAFKRNLKITF